MKKTKVDKKVYKKSPKLTIAAILKLKPGKKLDALVLAYVLGKKPVVAKDISCYPPYSTSWEWAGMVVAILLSDKHDIHIEYSGQSAKTGKWQVSGCYDLYPPNKEWRDPWIQGKTMPEAVCKYAVLRNLKLI